MSKDKEKRESSVVSDIEEESLVKKSTMKNDAYYVASSDESGIIITQVQLKENMQGQLH